VRVSLTVLAAVAALAAATGDAAQAPIAGRIVFATDRGGNVGNAEVYSVRLDGRGRRALSRNPGADAGAAWSPDGRRIALLSERFEGGRRVSALYVARSDGAAPRRLTPRSLTVAADSDGGLSWSPDGTRIAFDAVRGLQPGIWVVRADGSGLRKLAAGWDPVWSPQGNLIAFRARDGIRVVGAAGGAPRRVTRGAEDGFPAWAPDGSRLAFLRNVESRQTQVLYTVPARGGALRRHFGGGFGLTITRRPQWSPDGRRLAFAAGVGTFNVYVAQARGGAPRRLRRGDWPAWSPDGRRIAYTLGSALHVMNADGTRSRRVRSESGSDFSAGPTWSPDGRRLLFATFRLQRDLEIAVVNADGTGLRQLTRNTVHDFSPVWSRGRRQVAFVRRGAVWLMNSDGSRQRRLVAGVTPSWSPSGREVAFATGRGVHIVAAGGGAPRFVASGSLPAWAPRGGQVALVRGVRIVLVDLASGAERTLVNYEQACPVAPELTSIAGLDWSPDAQRILVTLVCDDGRFASTSANVIRADGEGGNALPIDDIFPSRMAFSPDGRRVVFVTEFFTARLATALLNGSGRTPVLRGDEGAVYDPDW
jgi:Tol biopolymer transport system component